MYRERLVRGLGVDKDLVFESIRRADVLKINEHEAKILEKEFSVPDAIQWLQGSFDLKCIVLTRGAQGSILYKDGEVYEQDAAKGET